MAAPHIEALRTIRTKYPEIADKLLEYWGSARFNTTLHGLLYTPQGVSADFAEELALIKRVHLQMFPQFPDNAFDNLPASLDESEAFRLLCEQMPRVAEELLVRWGDAEAFSSFMTQLLRYELPFSLDGLPPEVYSALVQLMTLHDTLFPAAD